MAYGVFEGDAYIYLHSGDENIFKYISKAAPSLRKSKDLHKVVMESGLEDNYWDRILRDVDKAELPVYTYLSNSQYIGKKYRRTENFEMELARDVKIFEMESGYTIEQLSEQGLSAEELYELIYRRFDRITGFRLDRKETVHNALQRKRAQFGIKSVVNSATEKGITYTDVHNSKNTGKGEVANDNPDMV